MNSQSPHLETFTSYLILYSRLQNSFPDFKQSGNELSNIFNLYCQTLNNVIMNNDIDHLPASWTIYCGDEKQ